MSAPTPWFIKGELTRRAIKDANGRTIIVVEAWTKEEDAKLIVTAVNSHAALLAVCQAVANIFDSPMGTVYELDRVVSQARAALAKAST